MSGRSLSPVGIGERTPHALDDVQVGAADAGAADAHDHVGRLFDFRIGNRLLGDPLLRGQRVVVFLQNLGLHGRSSCCRRFVGLAGRTLAAQAWRLGGTATIQRVARCRDCRGSERTAAVGVQKLDSATVRARRPHPSKRGRSMQPLTPIDRARLALERGQRFPEAALPAAIAESWRRCLAYGLDPNRRAARGRHTVRGGHAASEERSDAARPRARRNAGTALADRRLEFHDRLRRRGRRRARYAERSGVRRQRGRARHHSRQRLERGRAWHQCARACAGDCGARGGLWPRAFLRRRTAA